MVHIETGDKSFRTRKMEEKYTQDLLRKSSMNNISKNRLGYTKTNLSLKSNHFKDRIHNNSVKVIKIDNKLNWEEILTKTINHKTFETIPRFLMNW